MVEKGKKEGKVVMATEKVDPNKNFTILGSFKSGKHLSTIELEDEYYVECVQVGAGGSIKVGMVTNEAKKILLKRITKDDFTEEPEQTVIGDGEPEVDPKKEKPKGDAEFPVVPDDIAAVVKKVSYVDGSLNCPDRFFDEVHVYADFKHQFSSYFGVKLACCSGGYLIIDSDKAMKCASCGKIFSISSWVKPKASINF